MGTPARSPAAHGGSRARRLPARPGLAAPGRARDVGGESVSFYCIARSSSQPVFLSEQSRVLGIKKLPGAGERGWGLLSHLLPQPGCQPLGGVSGGGNPETFGM